MKNRSQYDNSLLGQGTIVIGVDNIPTSNVVTPFSSNKIIEDFIFWE